MTNWAGKRVVILGAARQGIALTRYLLGQGAQVVLSDAKSAPALDLAALPAVPALSLTLGGHPLTLLEGCDLLCLSGGVPIDLPIVVEARRAGVPLSNDAELFFERCPAPIIGITGSAGKTTTTTLLGEMLRAHESGSDGTARPVWVGGNIGNPLIEHVDAIGRQDHVVMELSSFQLDLMTRSPHFACITNITPNHLDRHGTMAAYTAAKKRILDFQTSEDLQVLCADDPVSTGLNTVAQTAWFSLRAEPQGDGAWLDEDGFLRLRIRKSGIADTICHRRELLLMGDHNILNVLAAAALAASAGAGLTASRGVARTFIGCCLLAAVCAALVPVLGTSLLGLVALRALQGLGCGPIIASGPRLAAEWFPAPQRGLFQGLQGAALSLGITIGLIAGPAIAANSGWPTALLWFGGVMAVALLLFVG